MPPKPAVCLAFSFRELDKQYTSLHSRDRESLRGYQSKCPRAFRFQNPHNKTILVDGPRWLLPPVYFLPQSVIPPLRRGGEPRAKRFHRKSGNEPSARQPPEVE